MLIKAEGRPAEKRQALKAWHDKEAIKRRKESQPAGNGDESSDDEAPAKRKKSNKAKKGTKRKEREACVTHMMLLCLMLCLEGFGFRGRPKRCTFEPPGKGQLAACVGVA